MQVASPARTVRPSKSRNGCSHCKSRRVKCDERKPGCLRCERNGLTCPGYQWNVRFSSKHEVYMQSKRSPNQPQLNRHSPLQPRDSPAQLSLPDVPLATTPVDATNRPTESFDDTDDQFWAGLEETAKESQPSRSPAAVSPVILFDEALPMPVESISTNMLPEPNPLDDSIAWTLQDIASETHDNVLDFLPFDLAAPPNLLLEDQEVSHRTLESSQPHQLRRTSETPMFVTLNDTPYALCSHFLKHVIGLFCVWDGPDNYMRTIAAQSWQSCTPLYHTMQSMAAACLAEDFPHLRQLARAERVTAFNTLRSQDLDSSGSQARSLALLLLAQTSHWHSPDELGIEQFLSVQRTLCNWQQETQDARSSDFITGCLNYWEMVLSFITEGDKLTPKDQEASAVASCEAPPQPRQPHEFSGVSSFMVKTLSAVGTLISNFRQNSHGVSVISEESALDFLNSLAKARHLEKKLLDYRVKDPDCVLETGDPTTFTSHFLLIDEAYRCTGLLQLYHMFPDLLKARYRPWMGHDELLKTSPHQASRRPTQEEMRKWRTELALHILGYLRKIPFESKTLCAQPWLLVAVATELRYNNAPGEGQLDSLAIEIAQARRFIVARIQAYMQILPLRKVRNVLDLVRAIWSDLDDGNLDIYWVDVAAKQRLTTLMG